MGIGGITLLQNGAGAKAEEWRRGMMAGRIRL